MNGLKNKFSPSVLATMRELQRRAATANAPNIKQYLSSGIGINYLATLNLVWVASKNTIYS